jgi:hypothetical protein
MGGSTSAGSGSSGGSLSAGSGASGGSAAAEVASASGGSGGSDGSGGESPAVWDSRGAGGVPDTGVLRGVGEPPPRGADSLRDLGVGDSTTARSSGVRCAWAPASPVEIGLEVVAPLRSCARGADTPGRRSPRLERGRCRPAVGTGVPPSPRCSPPRGASRSIRSTMPGGCRGVGTARSTHTRSAIASVPSEKATSLARVPMPTIRLG